MRIIQCAEKCIYQQDGYCALEEISTVNSVKGACPHCIPIKVENSYSNSESTNIGNGFAEGTNTD